MLALGSRLLGRTNDLEVGLRFAETCSWAYESSASGVGPESLTFYGNDDEYRYQEMTDETDGSKFVVPRGSPPGVRLQRAGYRGRPETTESLFYAYRITGDVKWQDKAWKAFTALVENCATEHGLAALLNVDSPVPRQDDVQGASAMLVCQLTAQNRSCSRKPSNTCTVRALAGARLISQSSSTIRHPSPWTSGSSRPKRTPSASPTLRPPRRIGPAPTPTSTPATCSRRPTASCRPSAPALPISCCIGSPAPRRPLASRPSRGPGRRRLTAGSAAADEEPDRVRSTRPGRLAARASVAPLLGTQRSLSKRSNLYISSSFAADPLARLFALAVDLALALIRRLARCRCLWAVHDSWRLASSVRTRHLDARFCAGPRRAKQCACAIRRLSASLRDELRSLSLALNVRRLAHARPAAGPASSPSSSSRSTAQSSTISFSSGASVSASQRAAARVRPLNPRAALRSAQTRRSWRTS